MLTKRSHGLILMGLALLMLATASLVLSQTGGGLQVQILGVELSGTDAPVVSLSLTDAAGANLAPEDLEGYGFTIAQIEQDPTTNLTRYQNLLVRDVEGAPYTLAGEVVEPALSSATQPFSDSGGEWVLQDDGTYTYTFANALTSEANLSLTTSVGIYAYKDGRTTVSNDVFTFVPDGSAVTVTREIATTDACNACHNPLALHGGVRREVGLCVTCHTDQNIDPETGNVLEFKQMIHRIHSGASLPSVVDGGQYLIVGFRQSVNNYSDIVWPQDVRNCTTCHTGPDGDNYRTAPSVAACTSCHDNVDPTTSTNHPGRPKTDEQCTECHDAEMQEFDEFSIPGAHLIPTNSTQLQGVNLEIISVDSTSPGSAPQVTFRVTTNSGEPIAPEDMDYLAVTIAGPTSDYQNRVTETIFRSPSDTPPEVADIGDGAYQYNLNFTLPEDATGSYAVGLEGYVMETISGLSDPVRVAGFNPVAYFALDGGDATPRRQVVDRDLCNSCHKDLALHGTIRQNTEYCVLCHNPNATDEAQRPEDAMPPASINFRSLIHRIHHGEEAAQPVQVYGFGNTLHDFGEVAFPGNLADCETCHLPGTNLLPLPSGVQPTVITQAGEAVSTIPAITTVCTACHDMPAAQGHAELQTTADGVETCTVCHGSGRDFDVAAVHD